MEGDTEAEATEDNLDALAARAAAASSSGADSREAGVGSPTSVRSTSPSGRRLERRASFSALDPEELAMRETLAAEAKARREAELKEQAARAVRNPLLSSSATHIISSHIRAVTRPSP